MYFEAMQGHNYKPKFRPKRFHKIVLQDVADLRRELRIDPPPVFPAARKNKKA
jgi:hypothetical protein